MKPALRNFWSSPAVVPSCYTESDPALTGDASNMYLAFQKKGTNQLDMARYEKSGRDWIWTGPVYTGQTSNFGPALTVHNGAVYMVWLSTDSTSHFSYGRLQDDGTFTFDGFVSDAVSIEAPTCASWNGALWVGYIDKDTRQIISTSLNGSKWSTPSEVHNQLSQDGPVFCTADNKLYLFHRGKTSEDIHYSARSTNQSDWPENEVVDDAISQERPGAGLFGNFLVMVHNGKKDPHIWWHYLDLGANVWHHMGLCGGEIDVGPITIEPRHLETNKAPALWLRSDDSGVEKGRLMMVYANVTDGSNQLAFSFLSEIG